MSFALFLVFLLPHPGSAPEESPSVLICCSLKVPKVLVFLMIWVISFIPTSLSPLSPRGDAKKQYFSRARAAAPMIGDLENNAVLPEKGTQPSQRLHVLVQYIRPKASDGGSRKPEDDYPQTE